MSNPRFIIAKYVPDLTRMEPRNIGLFLWHKGRIGVRFLPLNQIPFVNEGAVYSQWTEFWTDLVGKEMIDAPGRPPVSKRSEECIKSILATQDRNYILVDAGFVPQQISVRDVDKVTDYLFSELVAPLSANTEVDTDGRAPSIISQCNSIFERSGLGDREDFERNKPVECAVYGKRRHIHCDYYLGNGTPDAVFQRAVLSSEQSVNSGAFTIRALTEAALIPKEKCRFLVKKRDVMDESAEEWLDFLSTLCGVIDVDDNEAADQVLSVA